MSGMDSDFFADFFGGAGGLFNPTEQLDQAWRDACISGNFKNYDKVKTNVKLSGKRVFRNSKGKHKVV